MPARCACGPPARACTLHPQRPLLLQPLLWCAALQRDTCLQASAAASLQAILGDLLPRLLPRDDLSDSSALEHSAAFDARVKAMRSALRDPHALTLAAVSNAMEVVGRLEARLLAQKQAASAQVRTMRAQAVLAVIAT